MFEVYAKPNDTDVARFGVVVSKHLVPLAAARNYCKRLAREVFRAERAALVGVDLVVRARTAVTPASSAVARAEIRDLMRRAQSRCRCRAMLPQ